MTDLLWSIVVLQLAMQLQIGFRDGAGPDPSRPDEEAS
jgi:hypothetical protein